MRSKARRRAVPSSRTSGIDRIPMIRVLLLGRFAVERDGVEIPREAWRRSRPVDLVTQVALAAGRSLPREELVDRLWPEKDLAQGANNLYRALHDLRRIVGAPIVVLERGVVRLVDETWTDVAAFERAVDAGDPGSLSRAVELYRGDLLPEDPYSDALGARREALRGRFIDASLRLARHLQSELQDERAIDVLRRLLSIDPAQEEAHRSLMTLFARAGRRRDALEQFAICVRALHEAVEAAPSSETRALHRAIQRGEVGSAIRADRRPDLENLERRLAGRPDPPPLHGREETLRTIEAFVRVGRGTLVLLGEAGVGKTRIALEAIRVAHGQGAVVLVGAGLELGGQSPFGPFADAWAEYARATGAATDDDPFAAFRAAGSSQEDKLRLFQSVVRSIERASAGSPVCLLLEDVHLFDESSLHLLHYLARAVRTLPLLLIATSREEDVRVGSAVHTLLAALHSEQLARRILLDRLDRLATRRHVADVLGREPDDAAARAVFDLTSGNPFYTEEVVRTMLDSAAAPVPAGISDTVRSRVSKLGPDADALLVAASVVGNRFDFETVHRATALALAAALAALEAAVVARFVEEDGAGYRFRHALARQALYESLTRARRTDLHRRVADALEDDPATREEHPETLAHHHRAGGRLERALPWLVATGKKAMARVGFGEAAMAFGDALDLMDATGVSEGPDRFRLLLSLSQVRLALSDLDDSARAADAAAAIGTTPTERASARRCAAVALITGGDLAGADERLGLALRELDDGGAAAERVNVLYHLAQLRWHEERHREAYEVAEICLAEAERLGEPGALGRAYEMLALACHSLGEWREGAAFEEKRHAVAGGTLDVAQVFDVHL